MTVAGLASVLATAGALAGAGAAAGKSAAMSWLTDGFDAMRTGYNGDETQVGPSNVGRIHELWSVKLGDVMIAQPVEAAGVDVGGIATNVIYEGTEHGDFYAIRAGDGHVIWHRNLGSVTTVCPEFPGRVFGIGGAAVISFSSPGAGVVYVAGGDGAVHALDLATGAEQAGWPVSGVFTPSEETVWGGLNLFDGNLYVIVASHCDKAPYHGAVVEISVAAAAITNTFYPAGPPSGPIDGGGIWGSGGVSIDPATGDVYTATGNAKTTPNNYLYSDSVVQLSQSLGVIGFSKPPLLRKDDDLTSTPVLFTPPGCPMLAAVKHKPGTLLIYNAADIGSGPTQQLQLAGSRFNNDTAWDPTTNMLYVSNPSDSKTGRFKHGMVALKAGSDCKLSLAWQRTVGSTQTSLSAPTVANGVVYYGDGQNDTEFAFNAATGHQLWHKKLKGSLYAAPTVINGKLLVPAWDNKLYAFGL